MKGEPIPPSWQVHFSRGPHGLIDYFPRGFVARYAGDHEEDCPEYQRQDEQEEKQLRLSDQQVKEYDADATRNYGIGSQIGYCTVHVRRHCRIQFPSVESLAAARDNQPVASASLVFPPPVAMAS